MPGLIDATISHTAAGVSRVPALRILNEVDAIASAHALAQQLRREAVQRDQQRRLPHVEIEAFSASGLWAISVPLAYGGIGASWATVAEVVRIISAADPSIGQIPQNHFGVLNLLAHVGNEEQKRFFFRQVLKGARFGNAGPERNSKNVLDVRTRLSSTEQGLRLNGTRFYSTGALYADWVPTRAIDDAGNAVFVFVERTAEGLHVVDDWSGFGQRTTASGTVVFEQVAVAASHVLPLQAQAALPNNIGPVSQLIQAAIDAGIARAALDDTIAFVRERSRPWADSGAERAADDALLVAQVGALQVRLHAAEALLERAARTLDGLPPPLDLAQMAQASVAVAEAKVLTTGIALHASEKLFELAGTQSVLATHGLDRHWRNARVHTLHDPVRWKAFAVGNYYLNEIAPPRHNWS